MPFDCWDSRITSQYIYFKYHWFSKTKIFNLPGTAKFYRLNQKNDDDIYISGPAIAGPGILIIIFKIDILEGSIRNRNGVTNIILTNKIKGA